MADNEFLIGLVGGLDTSASQQKIERDISKLEKQLKNMKLKAEIDPSTISNIENQLKNLKASITDVNVSPQAISNIVTQINNALNGIQINNINLNPNGFRQQGQQVGKLLSQGVEDALDSSITSKEIGIGFKVKSDDSDDFQNAVNKEISELQKKSNTVVKVQYKTDTFDETTTDVFGNETTQKIERLTGAVFNYTTATGEAITKTMKWTQIGIDADDNPIMGWAQGLTTYTKSLGEASAKTNNFAKQQKATVANLLNQIKQINAAAIDPNASRSITDQTHLTTLKTKYDEITQAIQRMESASADTFVDEQNNVKSLIADFKILVSEYKNAENVRTSIKPDKIAESSSKVQSQFKSLQSNIIAANIPLDTMQDNLDSIQAVVDKIENKEIVSKAELENTLTLLQNCRDELKALKTEKVNASALEQLKYDAESLKSSLQTFGKQHTGFDSWKTQINGVEISAESLLEELKNVNNKTDFTTLEKKIKSFKDAFVASQDVITKLGNVQLKLDDGTYDTKVTDLIAKTQQWTDANGNARISVDDLNKAYKALTDADNDSDKIEAAKQLEQAIRSTSNEIRKMNIEYAKDSQIASLHQKIQEFYDKNSAAHATYGDSLKKMLKDTEVGAELTQSEIDEIATSFNNVKNQARQAGKLGLSLFDSIKTQAAKFGQWFSITSVITAGLQEGKKAVDFITKLDDALTDVIYTSDTSKSQLEALGNSAINMAKDLHTSAENILDAVKIYSTANATAEDILRKSQPAIMLSNVSGMSGSESSKTIQTSLNQFELEDTEEGLLDIVDTLEYVSSQLNYDFTDGIKEITEGIEASGNVAKNAGLSMQEYATMVGVAVEKTGQSGSTIGNAYKTIFSRITKASSSEGTLAEDISKAEGALRSIGVEVRDSSNDFRDLSDIMADLGSVWNTLSTVEKSNIGYEVAGTRQLNILNSLFGSWKTYSSIMSDIDDRTGTAMKNQEAYADSLAGHLGELTSVGQSVWNNLLDSETLKTGVDMLTGLLSIIDKLTSSVGLLGTIGIGAGLFAGFKNVGCLKMLVCPHHM